ncbi:hypothetical protein ACFHW2_26045 [Actinomadura sp. LOL_016]|uniref:hypothetical protein n=1 Tax=unclassified Actinomadura TaxID=2626254 RepID=UPI003A8016F4
MRLPSTIRRLIRRPVGAPSSFALILPDELTALDLVDGVGLAFARSRDVLAEQAKQARALAYEEEDRGRRAYLTGRADALTEAVARTETAMETLFAPTDHS